MATEQNTQQNMASLIPDELATRLAAQAKAAHQHGPQFLPSDPDLEKSVKQQIDEEVGFTRKPHPKEAERINDIMGEIRGEIATALPGVKFAADSTQLRIIDDAFARVYSYTTRGEKEDAHGHVKITGGLQGLAISAGALKNPLDASQSLTREELKATLAHEYAHHLLAINPELADDPRFQPRTAEFAAEYKTLEEKLKKNPLSEEEKKQLNDYQPPLNEKEKQQFIKDAVQNKLDDFYFEAVADKVGLYITKSPMAAMSAEEKIEALNSRIKRDLDSQYGKGITAEPGDTVRDPHPSLNAREAEIRASAEDMQKAAQTQQRGPQR